jgi:hypothetical protein
MKVLKSDGMSPSIVKNAGNLILTSNVLCEYGASFIMENKLHIFRSSKNFMNIGHLSCLIWITKHAY